MSDKNQNLNLLIIKDNIADVEFIKNLLKSEDSNHRFKHVNSIKEAISTLSVSTSYDVILVDLELPDSQNKLSTFDKIHSTASGIPLIVLSNVKDDNLAVETVKRGAQDYLSKDEITAPVLQRSITYSINRKFVMDELLQSKKMASIGTLAGGIAHDFNNLLTIILGYSDMGLSHCGDNKKLRKHLSEIKSAGTMAKELTQQLLTFSRNKPQKRLISNLNTIIEIMRKSLLRLISEKITINLNLDKNLSNNKVDTSQVERIIFNLCLNAQDAISPSGGTINISTKNVNFENVFVHGITHIPAGHYTRLRVQDNGSGIPKELIENIFEPFFTTKKLGETHHGAGMGLSIVYGAVLQARGYITVDSQVNKGSTFDIYFPKCIDAQISGKIIANPNTLQEADMNATILIVEDENGVRELVSQVLSDEGYHLLVASSPSEAITFNTQQSHIDLILTDILMPEMNGHDLVKLILKERPDIKVIFMSGYAEDALTIKGFDDIDASYLMKPFIPKQLIAKVNAALSKKTTTNTASNTTLSFEILNARKNDQENRHTTSISNKKPRILNVDDNKANATVLNKFLENYVDIEYASSGLEAISQFEKAHKENDPYDLILLDVMMPKISGIETLVKLRTLERENPNYATTKIILLTAIEESIEVLAIEPDMFYDSYLQKPVTGTLIIKEMEKLGLIIQKKA